MSSICGRIDFGGFTPYIGRSNSIIPYFKGACTMGEKASNGKRLDILVVVENPRLCQGFQSDNEIALASRCNAHSVVFSGFVPLKMLGKLHGHSRVIIFNEVREVGHDFYAHNLRKEVTSNGGITFTHGYPEKDATNLDALSAKMKPVLIKNLGDIYRQLDSQ